MCNVVNSRPYKLTETGLIMFNETMEFVDLDLKNIPRMARLCFMFSMVFNAKNKNKFSSKSSVKKIRSETGVCSLF